MSFKSTLLASCASSLPTMSDSKPKTCFAYTSKIHGSASWRRMEFFSRPAGLQSSGGGQHAFAVGKVPKQVPGTSSGALQNLNTRSVHQPFRRLLLRSQHHIISQTVTRCTKNTVLGRNKWYVVHLVCPLQMIFMNLPTASVVCVVGALSAWRSWSPEMNG